MDRARLRSALFAAMQAANVPGTFGDDLRRAFLDEGQEVDLAALGLDSLARMEFCIAIELSLGIALLPRQLDELGSTDAIERFVTEALGSVATEAARPLR